MQVVIYLDNLILCSYEGVPPLVGETIWVQSPKYDVDQAYVVRRREFQVAVVSDRDVRAKCEIWIGS
jgi:hypothetical protein